MTPLACITFTRCGEQLAERLRLAWPQPVEIFTTATYKAALPRLFQESRGLVFIAATGIAVRLIAPLLRDKAHDPAVIVIDDLGRYAISLLSGHLGGANALTRQLAATLGCQPIITTASDGRGFESLDCFAQRHGLVIADLREAKAIAALMADGRPIRLMSEMPVTLDYPHLVEHDADGGIIITTHAHVDIALPHCIVHPKILHVGVGCRKGKSAQEILDAIQQVFQQRNLSLHSLRCVATAAAKQDERGLVEAARILNAELRVCPHEQIRAIQGQFHGSAFVEQTLGISAVSEPCACLSAGVASTLLVGKTAMNGVTVAVAQENAS